jgi:hypothetical protein
MIEFFVILETCGESHPDIWTNTWDIVLTEQQAKILVARYTKEHERVRECRLAMHKFMDDNLDIAVKSAEMREFLESIDALDLVIDDENGEFDPWGLWHYEINLKYEYEKKEISLKGALEEKNGLIMKAQVMAAEGKVLDVKPIARQAAKLELMLSWEYLWKGDSANALINIESARSLLEHYEA